MMALSENLVVQRCKVAAFKVLDAVRSGTWPVPVKMVSQR
jgi:hypothetical protein